ncbi:MAG: fumarate reductase/succinate dehydrogenase flavoprotein domain protein, partial [Sedimentibacter sp.]|nr:fumarate reductase/succinate dehydrogenase flavoprotein domain protein [Sedimentibacter sp.]
MKKILALLVCVLMLFSLVACADDNGNADEGNDGVVDEAADKADEGTADEGAIDDAVDDAVDDADDAKGNIDTGNGDNKTLEGTAQGYGGEVKVTVEVKGDDIISVNVVGEKETQGVGSNALEQLPDKIEAADSTDVEVVSGATVTSNAIKEAV